ncbi:MAG: hypothetical protein EA424_04700 [Planctomycetaceae bacterium]|nr:MAG: hypothetical protein EA424_04700 [Planctomycetaceae bacterium]
MHSVLTGFLERECQYWGQYWGQTLFFVFLLFDSPATRDALFMARPLRTEFAIAICHVMSRSNARQRIFDDERD